MRPTEEVDNLWLTDKTDIGNKKFWGVKIHPYFFLPSTLKIAKKHVIKKNAKNHVIKKKCKNHVFFCSNRLKTIPNGSNNQLRT